MTSPATTTQARGVAAERAVALATTFAPLVTGVGAPFLGDSDSAAFLTTLAYGAATGFLSANYADAKWLVKAADDLPGGDILRAHRAPLFISSLTSLLALGTGAFTGLEGADSLMGGFTHVLDKPVPGIVSLGWWAAVLMVPVKLRKVLSRKAHPALTKVAKNRPQMSPEETDILEAWRQYISHPRTGAHKNQALSVRGIWRNRYWTGVITAPAGQTVNVSKENVSSAYRVPAAQIVFKDGAHAGERHITVSYQPLPEMDPSTLTGAWKKWVARSGGLMADTELEDAQRDPATGGEVAYVVAGETLDKLPTPDHAALAGALRTTTLLCSYSPEPGNPRRGRIRLMKHNPLEEGVPFPGTDVLKISEGGYVQVGRHVSGFPARIQFTDPKLGAKHLFVAGVTGSGKGGLVQIVALADHVNGHAILYGDPKGSSNPDVETMACYSGLVDDVIGVLRVAYALLKWRMEESARLGMKNFQPTPDRPWVRVIIDEAHTPLSEMEEHKKEAGIIVEALASKARSQGIILTLVNQAVNADKLGGSTTLRTNVIQGGSLVMLRTDSDQKHLVTTGFEGVDPGQIPAAWDVERPLVYDEKVQMADPRATYGLGYTLGPGGAAEMMRTFILESAAPYIDTNNIAYPADWPDWDNRDEIAATSILGGGGEDGALFGDSFTSLLDGPSLAKKPEPSAEKKILTALDQLADPRGIDINYVDKDTLLTLTKLEPSTLDNTLSKLAKARKIHRPTEGGKEIRGMYGPGPAPQQDQDAAE